MYSPTMSRSLGTNSGSRDSLNCRTRCGWRPCERQMRCTEEALIQTSAAIAAAVQCVVSPGGSVCVSATTRSAKLRWFADTLGETRNLDVFAATLLSPARAALPEGSEFERLARAATKRRRIAHAAVQESITSDRYRVSLQALRIWFENGGWIGSSSDRLEQRIEELAPILLERCYRRAIKCSRHFSRQSEEERHRLRLALKKLRYAAEFLENLFDPKEIKPFIRRLKRLQDDLGYINDIRVGREIVAILADESEPAIGVGYAGARAIAWHQHRLSRYEPDLKDHLREFFDTEPFWR